MNTCSRVEDGKVRLFKRGEIFSSYFLGQTLRVEQKRNGLCGEEEKEGRKRTLSEKPLPLDSRGPDY